jgi:hypothetical protein
MGTSCGCNTLFSNSCCFYCLLCYTADAAPSLPFLCTFLPHSSHSSLGLLGSPRQLTHSGGKCWKCARGGLLDAGSREWSRPPKPTLHWGVQVITFNEIWASQRHERLQTCGLCKNLIFMNLVKEKLRSASYRRYVWVDMHPSVDPWGPEGLYSDWAMHLSSYKEWHRVVCARLSVKAANTSRTSPFASQECQLSVSYGSVWP